MEGEVAVVVAEVEAGHFEGVLELDDLCQMGWDPAVSARVMLMLMEREERTEW